MASQQVKQYHGADPRFFYGHIIVVAASFIMIAVWGTYHAFGVFFKPVLTEFGWTRATTSGAFSLSMVMHGLLSIVMGGLTDRLGSRLVMTICGLFLGIGYLLMSQISAVWQLYLVYGVIIGIGMGGSFVPLVSTVARWFIKRRSMMTGIVVSGIGVGTLVAPPLATYLIYSYDWRISYLILGSVVLVVIVIAAQFLRHNPAKIGQRPYGEGEGEEKGLTLGTDALSLREAVHTRQLWIVCGMFFCFAFCLFTVTVHIVPHATELGISAASAANSLAIIGGISIAGKLVLGSAGDRIGSRWIFIIGFILMSAALFWLVPATEVWMLYLFASVFGFAYGGCGAAESPLVAWLFGLKSHGLILGVTGFAFTIGGAIGPFLAGYIFDVNVSYRLAFLVSGAVGIIGLILSALLKPTGKN